MSVLEEQAKQIDTPENVDTTGAFQDAKDFKGTGSTPEKVEQPSTEESAFLDAMNANTITVNESGKKELSPYVRDLTLLQTPEQLEGANLKAQTYENQMQGEIAKWDPEYDKDFIAGGSIADNRYRNQSGMDLFGSALVQVANELTLGTLEGAATIASIGMHARAFRGEEKEFTNGLIQAIRDTKKEIAEEHGQIYRKEDAGFDITDPTFWAENAGNMATSLSLMLPTMGVMKGAGAIGRLSGVTGALKRAGRLGKALRNPAVSSALKGIAGAFVSRLAENTMEASEAVESIKTQLTGTVNPETGVQYTDEEISDIAGRAGQSTWNWNWAMGLVDAVQYTSLFKGFDFARLAAKDAIVAGSKTAAETASKQGAKKALGSFFKTKMAPGLTAFGNAFATDMVPEGLEEGYQYMVSQEAQYQALHPKEKFSKAGLINRISSHLSDEEFYSSVFFGAIGGGIFGTSGKVNERLQKKKRQQVRARVEDNYKMMSAALKGPKEFSEAQTDVFVSNAINLAKEGSLDLFESDIAKIGALSDAELMEQGIKVEEFRNTVEKARNIAMLVGKNYNEAMNDSNIKLKGEHAHLKTMEDLLMKDRESVVAEQQKIQSQLDAEEARTKGPSPLKKVLQKSINKLLDFLEETDDTFEKVNEMKTQLESTEGTREFIKKVDEQKVSDKMDVQDKSDVSGDLTKGEVPGTTEEREVTADEVLASPEVKEEIEKEEIDPTKEIEEEDTGDTDNAGSKQQVMSSEPEVVEEEPEFKKEGLIYYNGQFDTVYSDLESKRDLMAEKGVGLIPDHTKEGRFIPVSDGTCVMIKGASTMGILKVEDGKVILHMGSMSTEKKDSGNIESFVIQGEHYPVNTRKRVEQSDSSSEIIPTKEEAEVEEVKPEEKGTQKPIKDATEDSLQESEDNLVEREQAEVTSEEEATTTVEQVPQNKLEIDQQLTEEKEKEPEKVNDTTEYDFSELSDLRSVSVEFSNFKTEKGSKGKYYFIGNPESNNVEAFTINYGFAEEPMTVGESIPVTFELSSISSNGKVFDVVLIKDENGEVVSKLAASGKTMKGNLQMEPFNELVKLLKEGKEVRGVVKDKVASLRGSLGTVKNGAFKLSEYRDVNLPEGKVMIGGVYKSTDNRITLYDSEGKSRSIPIKEQTLQPGVTYMAVKHPNGSTKLIPLKETQFNKSDAEAFLTSFQELADKFNDQLSKELESATSDAERADIVEKFKNTNLATRDSIANSELRDLVEKTGLRTKHAVKSDTGYSYTAEHFVPRFQLIDGKVTPTIETAYTDAQGNIRKRTNKDFKQMRSKVNGKYRSIKHEQLVNTDYFKNVVDNQVTCDVFPGRMWVDTALSIDVTSIDNTKSDNKVPTVDPVEIPTVEETTTPEKEETTPAIPSLDALEDTTEDELELEDPFSDEEDEDYRPTRTKVNERVRVENSANSQEKETTTEQAEVKETTTSEEEIGEEDFVDLYEDAEEGIEDELEADCIFTNNLIS